MLKTLIIMLARKYAADLLVRAALEAVEKLAPRTESKIDDRIVEILKAEQGLITETVTKRIGG